MRDSPRNDNADPMRAWSVDARAKDGTAFRIRPLRGDDREREVEFINSLSEQARYFRLFTPMRYLPPHLVDQLMDVDGRNRVAFVATIDTDGRERFIGIARYGAGEDPHSVELGITVLDDWQGRGIARQLVEHLCRYALAQGFTRMIGVVLPQNTAMLSLARRMKFSLRSVAGGLVEIERGLVAKDS